MAILISADDIKKELEGYTPDRAGEFHIESAKIADKRFEEQLKLGTYDRVILMSGGPASGKTEYVSEYLMDQEVLILDGVLPTEKGAEIKIRNIKKAGKKLVVHAVWPRDLKQAYVAFLHRDRKFDDAYFFDKHASARTTLLWIAIKHPDVDISIIESVYAEGDLAFTKLAFDTREALVAYIVENQYTADKIAETVSK